MPSPDPDVRRHVYARVDAAKTTGELWIYDDIGPSQSFFMPDGIMAKDVIAAIEQCKAEGAKALNIYVNSGGGNVFEGASIHSAIARFQGPKTVYVDGVAASIAHWIAMAGDKVCVSPASWMMVHMPGGLGRGSAEDMRKAADFLDKIRDGMVEGYAQRTGQDAASILAMMEAETWMTGKECVEKGFADEVVKSPGQANAPPEMSAAASALSPLLADYSKLPLELKKKLFAQHPHLQSPQARAPIRVPPTPRASGTIPASRSTRMDIETATAEAQQRAVTALTEAHKTELGSVQTRLTVMTGERDTLNTQLSAIRAELTTAKATIQSHETVIAGFRTDASAIFELTGKTNLAEARGVIAAYKAGSAEADQLRAQLAADKEKNTKASFLALIEKGVTAGKITPAESENLKTTLVADIPTTTAFIENFFMKRDPLIQQGPTGQKKPEGASLPAGMDEETAAALRASGMDPEKVAAAVAAGKTPQVA